MFKPQAAFSGLSVDDLPRARQFYTNTLGLAIESEEMGLRLVLPGGGKMFIYPKEDHQPANYTVLNFVVSDIDKAVDDLEKMGVVFEFYDNMPGMQDDKGILRGRSSNQGPDIAWFKDPSGNIIAVLQEK